MNLSILLVEDDEQQRKLLTDILSNAGFFVKDLPSCEDAIVYLKGANIDVVFSDWKLPQLSGLDLLNYVRRNRPELGFVMATAHGTIEHAVEAMQAGADDYLAKPFQRQELLLAIDKAAKASKLRQQNSALSAALESQQQLTDFVGVSEKMQLVQQRISRVASTGATVLINGESGTGKELAARAIHNLSERRQHNFVAINCGAIPSELAEAELFGAKKGAYTGANTEKIGKCRYADGGTLFLDEIGELPLNLQAKILRFLQEGSITPLGSNEEMQLDVRVIAASHRDLAAMVQSGDFREDLYYRLNIVPIQIPPLRQRPEDIPLLAEFFYSKFAKRYGMSGTSLSTSQLKRLKTYSWPGNVRQLSNQMERYALLGDEQELFANLSVQSNSNNKSESYILPENGIDLEKLEASLLEQALSRAGGNRTQAAKLLNVNYKAFLYRLEKHGLQ
ncbi:sigma-54-dependent transcriptional regulator [Ningiella sp. W23]|uniref:sigma-54-dependent transcriptional regulator n=1 Tax=Ningiella sp. W23 TaxID=3023715 RepID=UPI003756FECE